jgi:fatty acid desaturase
MFKNVDKEAAKMTAMFFAKAIAIGIIAPIAFIVLPWQVIIGSILFAVFVFLVYTVYKMNLSRLNWDRKYGDSRFK